MKFFVMSFSLFVLASLLAPRLCAGDLEIKDPWIRAMPPSSQATAAFMIIVNKGREPVTLVAGATPISPEVKPMITTQTRIDGQEVMGMEFVKSFTIPAGKKYILAPGGDHIMLMKLKRAPKRGENLPLTLTFECGEKREEILLNVPVR